MHAKKHTIITTGISKQEHTVTFPELERKCLQGS